MQKWSGLFGLMEVAGLTTLWLRYSWRRGEVSLRAAREWDPGRDWQNYTRDFHYEDLLTAAPLVLGDKEVRELFDRRGLGAYLEDLVDLLRQGRHQGVEVLFERELGIGFFNVMHSNTLGVGNGYHAIRSGGIRRHDPEEEEREVIIDGLNLSRAMSYKNAAARIPFGGSKLILRCAPVDLEDMPRLGFIAYAIDRSRSFTGPDMGLTPAHADVLRRHFTRNITGGFQSPLGPTGNPTAEGVFLALQEACLVAFGDGGLKGRRIALQGLGAVGYPLAEMLLRAGAELIVADLDERRCRKLLDSYPAGEGYRVSVVEPARIYEVEAEIFAPCAMGGVITEELIPRLRFRVIMGSANNQLRATSQQEEVRLARLLADRGILYQVDWMHNTAGVMAGCEEYLRQEKAALENIRPLLREVCGRGTGENLREAARLGITPTERAYRLVEAKVYGTDA